MAGEKISMLARQVISHLASSGTPPEEGVELYSVGFDDYIHTLREEYLENLIPKGLSTFKLVIGSYGGGKTHFLYLIRNLARHLGYVVGYVSLSPSEAPFSHMESIAQVLMNAWEFPLEAFGMDEHYQYNRGIESFLYFYYTYLLKKLQLHNAPAHVIQERLSALTIPPVESSSFHSALTHALRALSENDTATFTKIVQWLKGEPVPPSMLYEYGIVERFDKRTAFRLIRSFAQWVASQEFKGTVILFDEAERALSLFQKKAFISAMDNLRQWIDECGSRRFPAVLTLYAVPDEYHLTDKPGPQYEALRQRLQTIFDINDPLGVKIYLERLSIPPDEFLMKLGIKLTQLFEKAYNVLFPEELVRQNLNILVHKEIQLRYADVSYRRVFVTTWIPVLQKMRAHKAFFLAPEDAETLIADQLKFFEEQEVSRSDDVEF